MMIEAEYNEIEDSGEQLDFAAEEGLPWLESDSERDDAGGVDTIQIVGFVALLVIVLMAVLGLVTAVSNYNSGPEQLADGSLIEAPDGPIKERPENAGGKRFAGTGDVAPGVGQGEAPDARMAELANAGQTVDAPTEAASQTSNATEPSAPSTSASESGPATAGASAGVGVQVGAYSSRERAEQGWRVLQRQSQALVGLKSRILEGQADRGRVFRLQAVTPTRAEANALCRTLKSQGLDCQVKG